MSNPMENPMGKMMDGEVLRGKSGVPTAEEEALETIEKLPPGTTKDILARHFTRTDLQKKTDAVHHVELPKATEGPSHSGEQQSHKKKKRLYGKMGAANDDSDEE